MKNYKGELKIEIEGVQYKGIVELTPASKQEDKVVKYTVYGVKINHNDPNPETSVEYIKDATGWEPTTKMFGKVCMGSMGDKFPFNAIKPCIVKGNDIVGYLNPDCFYEFADGKKAPITDPNAGNVMIEIPKVFYRITQDDKFTYIEITDSADSLEDGFTDWAFSHNGKVHDKIYIGAYKGSFYNGKLCSVSNATLRVNETIGTFRTAAQKNGVGYEITTFNKLTLLQVLYVIMFKNLDSQNALGKGLTNGDGRNVTGRTDNKGMHFGGDDKTQIKFLGIEDFWGNVWEWVDGLATNGNEIRISDGKFNDDLKDYEMVSRLDGDVYGLMTKIRGTNKLGFAPAECDDDNDGWETHFSNYASMWAENNPRFALFGGYWAGGASAGAFYLLVNVSAASAYAIIGARLCFVLDDKKSKGGNK